VSTHARKKVKLLQLASNQPQPAPVVSQLYQTNSSVIAVFNFSPGDAGTLVGSQVMVATTNQYSVLRLIVVFGSYNATASDGVTSFDVVIPIALGSGDADANGIARVSRGALIHGGCGTVQMIADSILRITITPNTAAPWVASNTVRVSTTFIFQNGL
jgi:hypothetical protein